MNPAEILETYESLPAPGAFEAMDCDAVDDMAWLDRPQGGGDE